MARRILIVGGTRFIGAHVARRLVESGADVTVFHRGETDNPILPPVEHVRDASAFYPIAGYPQALARDWDAVIHMVLMGEEDGRIAAAFFAGRAGRLAMISSGDVYRAYGRLTGHEPGEPDPVPLTEDAPLRERFYPYRGQERRLGAYARDYEKILAERAIRNAPGLSATILRLPKVYGPGDNADLGTVYAFASQPHWRWTHGHVENVAAGIVLAAEHPAAAGRTFNIGEAETPTMGERLARLPVRNRPQKAPPFDYRQHMECDTSRIRRELGFREVLDEAEAMLALARENPGNVN